MAPHICFSLLHLLLALPVAVVSANPSGGHPIDFSYWGKEGSNEWGKHYKTCDAGKIQSPININTNEIVINKTLTPLTRSYKPSNATLVDSGVNIGVRYETYHAQMTIDGKVYSMRLMHWHSPSEHTIDGVQYPLELHLVHEAEDNNLAVVGLLYEYGAPDPFISTLNTSLSKLAEMVENGQKAAEAPLGVLDPRLLGKKTPKYYRYVGSLTTPPCSEPVLWTVLPWLRTVTKEQVAALKSPLAQGFRDNCRPVQPLNGRKVEMYDGPDNDDTSQPPL